MKTKANVFKKFLVVCLSAALVLAMALPVSAASGYTFTYKSVSVKPGDNASKLIKKINKKPTRKKSCAYKGQDSTYKAAGFTLVTYSNKTGGTEYVLSITFNNSGVSTKEGVKIGSTLKTVQNKYSKKAKQGVNTFTKGKTKLQITIGKSGKNKDKVTAIKYLKK